MAAMRFVAYRSESESEATDYRFLRFRPPLLESWYRGKGRCCRISGSTARFSF